MQIIYLGLNAASAVILQCSYSSSIAYEFPIHTALTCILTSALSLYVASRYYPRAISNEAYKNEDHDQIGVKVGSSRRSHEDDPMRTEVNSSQPRYPLIIVSAAVVLAIRLEIFRLIRLNEACVGRSYQAFVPFILSFYDLRSQDQFESISDESPDSSIYDDISSTLYRFFLRPRWRYILPAFIVSAGCHALTNVQHGQASTIICTIHSGEAAWIPRLQLLAVPLDCLLAMVADWLLSGNNKSRSPMQHTVAASLQTLIGAAIAWCTFALSQCVLKDNAFEHFSPQTDQIADVFLSIIGQAVLCSIFLISIIHITRSLGVLTVSISVTAILSIAPSFALLWSAHRPYPPVSSSASLWSFLLIFFGIWIYLWILRASSMVSNAYPRISTTMAIIVLAIALWPGILKQGSIYYHPIDLLMYDAKIRFEEYSHFATNSKDLRTAVSFYQKQYQENPPPGFDAWWRFASDRKVTITDDFDQIFVDLLPFRAVEPAELRRQTIELLSTAKNGISGIRIKKGVAEVYEDRDLADDSMLKGVSEMISHFAEHLPDMHLAFNLEQYSRVASRAAESDYSSNALGLSKFSGTAQWSQNRAEHWVISSRKGENKADLEDLAGTGTFAHLSSTSCSAGSAARRQHFNQFQPYMCVHCAAPHSFGQFMSNWSLAMDYCHQPDLANLHELYLSTQFKATKHLQPIFSQSKAHGFGDILYPSARNYIGSIVYKPDIALNQSLSPQPSFPDLPLSQKVNALYWRGKIAESMSPGNRIWRGMAKQRLVHMANNLTTSHHDHVTVLLPHPYQEGRYSYQTLSAADLLNLGLSTDIHSEDHNPRCTSSDCVDQESELGAVPPIDFQNHWKYRFLIDVDGAGATQEFLPFLQSHSVPFKSSLHGEWYDSRLTPWRHFVPQDIRLHGLWSTLAYFAGVDGKIGSRGAKGGRRVKWEPHLREAEVIAEQGRDWANKILRKEDMEVYMFRLLLEWARLTDDRRDELGFTLND